MSDPYYARKLPGAITSVGAPGGTSLLQTEANLAEADLLASMSAGDTFWDPAQSYDISAGTWIDRKSGKVATRLKGTMLAAVKGLDNRYYVPWSNTNAAVLGTPSDSDIWPVGGDFTTIGIWRSTGGMNGAFIGLPRITTSVDGDGVVTGSSFSQAVVATDSTAGHNERTANATSLMQTDAATVVNGQLAMWVMSRDYAGGAGRVRKNNTEIRAVTGITRNNQYSNIIIGAAGYVSPTTDRQVRNTQLYALITIKKALHKVANADLLAKVERWASLKFPTLGF